MEFVELEPVVEWVESVEFVELELVELVELELVEHAEVSRNGSTE